MAHAVFSLKKLSKGALMNSSRHDKREMEVLNADGSKTVLNEELVNTEGKNYTQLVSERLKSLEQYRTRNIRSDAVYAISVVLAVPQERAESIDVDAWKKKSMEACNYKCVLSGEKFTDIHHIFGFNMIVDQVLQRLKIYTVEMPEFTQEQLDIILKEFKQEQDKHPLGACLRKDLHISFHQIYGHGNNTIEQWKQYVSAYKSNYQSKN